MRAKILLCGGLANIKNEDMLIKKPHNIQYDIYLSYYSPKSNKIITLFPNLKQICIIKFYPLLLHCSYTHCYVITKGRGTRPDEALATL